MFAKIHGIIVLELSGTLDMSIVQTGRLCFDSTFAEPFPESIALISLNQFEICWEFTTQGSFLLDLANEQKSNNQPVWYGSALLYSIGFTFKSQSINKTHYHC